MLPGGIRNFLPQTFWGIETYISELEW
jgi:hypothetical protein